MALPKLNQEDYITKCEHFIGFHNLQNMDCKERLVYIDQFEDKYLCKIFGCDLGKEIKAQILTDAVNPANQKIISTFCEDVTNLCCDRGKENIFSHGLVWALTGFIYFETVTSYFIKPATNGLMNEQVDGINSLQLLSTDQLQNLAQIRYNDAVHNGTAIQRFIKSNIADYPLYKGSCIDPIFYGIV